MQARLLYVMDPMCSWCWGFAPVLESLAEQAAAAGVGLQLVLGGLRRDGVAIDAAARVRYLGYWQAVNASTGQLFDFERGLPEGLVYDTEPACRALVTARQLDAASAWTLVPSTPATPTPMNVRAAQLRKECIDSKPPKSNLSDPLSVSVDRHQYPEA